MEDKNRQLYRSLGFLSGIGISLVASIVMGLFIGYHLDRWLGTTPWLTLLFIGFGVIAGYRNIFILARRELRRQQEEDATDVEGQ